MESKIHTISAQEMAVQKMNFQLDESTYIVEIDGATIQSLEKYLSEISDKFKFPVPSRHLGGYNDWMRDLDWLGKSKYVLIIYNYNEFLSKDVQSKKVIMDNFLDCIFPWWQTDVEKYCVDGKAKPFNVYLVT